MSRQATDIEILSRETPAIEHECEPALVDETVDTEITVPQTREALTFHPPEPPQDQGVDLNDTNATVDEPGSASNTQTHDENSGRENSSSQEQRYPQRS